MPGFPLGDAACSDLTANLPVAKLAAGEEVRHQSLEQVVRDHARCAGEDSGDLVTTSKEWLSRGPSGLVTLMVMGDHKDSTMCRALEDTAIAS
jgi:hypothetical protein